MAIDSGWDLSNPSTVTAWTPEAFRARAAQERHLELRAQDADEVSRRDAALRQAANAGCPLRELARLVGVSRQTIYAVLGTEPPPRV